MYWVNGTRLATFEGPNYDLEGNTLALDSTFRYFKFPRFTGYSVMDAAEQNASYIYHQLSPTVIAEEFFSKSIGNWASTNITIETS